MGIHRNIINDDFKPLQRHLSVWSQQTLGIIIIMRL
jgi:hypothetical protein